jgi:pyrimidine operon attenuation protein/uracil phosphoribosyltransferase
MPKRTQILDKQQADMKLSRIAYEIVEQSIDEAELFLAGIIDRGLTIAHILKDRIEEISSIKVSVLQIQMDKENPLNAKRIDDVDVSGKTVIIVDDVANSGRTSLYAIRLFLDSLPRKIQLAVLVDRKHKQFPVSSDYIGLMLSTNLQDHIFVEVKNGKVTSAWIE